MCIQNTTTGGNKPVWHACLTGKTFTMVKIGLLFSLLFLWFTTESRSQSVYEHYLDGVLFVMVDPESGKDLRDYQNLPALVPLTSQFGIDTIIRPFPNTNELLENTYRVEFSNIVPVDDFIDDLLSLDYIDHAEKMPLYQTTHTPNDLGSQQWSLHQINAQGAWDVTLGSPDVVIAIIDNGVRLDHEDLEGNIWINPDPNTIGGSGIYFNDYYGYDVADGNNDPSPPGNPEAGSPFNHGTHCAGIASAVTNNGAGIASIGYNASIMAVKVTPDESDGNTLTHAYEGIHYAVDAGADILSMSFGSQGQSMTGSSILNYAHSRNRVLIAAAGNNNTSDPFYPAYHDVVIAVGATNSDDQKASFSNYGDYIDVMAPGVNILSTLAGSNDAYGNKSGTSMAAPIVSGLAALILSYENSLSPGDVKRYITDGCEPINNLNPDYSGELGAGRINAENTLALTTGFMRKPEAGNAPEVYPNPARSTLYISFPKESFSEILRVSLFQINGKLLHSESPEPGSTHLTVNTSDFIPGIYLLEVISTHGMSTEKVLIR